MQLDVFHVAGAAVQCECWQVVPGVHCQSVCTENFPADSSGESPFHSSHTQTGLKQKPGKEAVQLQSVCLSSNVSGSSPEAESS